MGTAGSIIHLCEFPQVVQASPLIIEVQTVPPGLQDCFDGVKRLFFTSFIRFTHFLLVILVVWIHIRIPLGRNCFQLTLLPNLSRDSAKWRRRWASEADGRDGVTASGFSHFLAEARLDGIQKVNPKYTLFQPILLGGIKVNT